MAAVQIPRENLSRSMPLSSTISPILRSRILSSPAKICTSLTFASDPNRTRRLFSSGRSAVLDGLEARVTARVSDSQLKLDWLDSLSCPFRQMGGLPTGIDEPRADSGSEWVVGIDPDASGALALLKPDLSGCSAQVFDTPYLKVLVGKKVRKRLDAKSIVQLLRSLGAPLGTLAYIEQSSPFPQDGKQGWWCGGFTYGLWIGILVASGFSVIPVSSRLWKDKFELSRNSSTKDDSRMAASNLFPSLVSSLKRKKDHGRAEALLIAAYGKGLAEQSNSDASIPT